MNVNNLSQGSTTQCTYTDNNLNGPIGLTDWVNPPVSVQTGTIGRGEYVKVPPAYAFVGTLLE